MTVHDRRTEAKRRLRSAYLRTVKTAALVPFTNDAYTLPFAVESMAPHFDEIVLLDDRSTDESAQIAADLARRHLHVRLIQADRPSGGPPWLGWVKARQMLADATEAGWLFHLDADHVVCDGAGDAFREIGEKGEPAVVLPTCDMWGDMAHTTQRVANHDPCHVFWNRREFPDGFWIDQDTISRLALRAAPDQRRWMRWPAPLLFHLCGVKPDARLVERAAIRRWMRSASTKPLARFAGTDRMCRSELHSRARRILFGGRYHRIRRYDPATCPPLPAVLQTDAAERFEVIYGEGRPYDRLDHTECREPGEWFTGPASQRRPQPNAGPVHGASSALALARHGPGFD